MMSYRGIVNFKRLVKFSFISIQYKHKAKRKMDAVVSKYQLWSIFFHLQSELFFDIALLRRVGGNRFFRSLLS